MEDNTIMDDIMPQDGDTSVAIPMTFDYQGGRSENTKNGIFVTIVTFALTIVFGVLFLMNSTMFIPFRILIFCAILWIEFVLLRKKMLDEDVYSDAIESKLETDYKIDTSAYWNIFEIENFKPYLCYFKSNKKGVYIFFEKDVSIGKPSNIRDKHYNAIGEGLRRANVNKLGVCHIDYMSSVGTDTRLKNSIKRTTENKSNEDLQVLLLDFYSNMQYEASDKYSSYDVFLLTADSQNNNFMQGVEEFISELMCGNYITYRFLKKENLRKLPIAVFNLNDFSVAKGIDTLFQNSRLTTIKPVALYSAIDDTVLKDFTKQVTPAPSDQASTDKDKPKTKSNKNTKKVQYK